MNNNSGGLKSSLHHPSNVTRISRAIKSISSDGIPQVVSYHEGIGSSGSLIDRIIGGASGEGLDEIVREGYQFVATNYTPGDEIFLFGFSRGGFTARAICGLINEVGVLTKDGLPYLTEIYRDVRNRRDVTYRPRYPDEPFPNKPSADDPEYRRQLQRRGLTRLNVTIKVVGVWDTVGSLGIPKVGLLTKLRLQSTAMRELRFYDTSLPDCVEYAFQALALDERRFAFQPSLWEKVDDGPTILRQVWFPGAHANVGGGYDDQQIATISLAWMVAQCQPFIDFDLDYVLDQWDDCERFYEARDQPVRPWSFGAIFSGLSGIYNAGGVALRKPGRYCAVDPNTGKETGEPLMDTREYIHPSVRARFTLKGPGVDDDGRYECKPLRPWKLVIESEGGQQRPMISWIARDEAEEGFAREIPEAPLRELEKELLEYDQETMEYVLRPSGVRRRRSTRKKSRSRSTRPR